MKLNIQNTGFVMLACAFFLIVSFHQASASEYFENREYRSNNLDFTIRKIPSGLTNNNYEIKIPSQEKSIFVRNPTSGSNYLYIDRSKEKVFLKKAYELGLAPEIYYFDAFSGFLVTEFLEDTVFYGKVGGLWTEEQHKSLERVADVIRKYHSVLPHISQENTYHFALINNYLKSFKESEKSPTNISVNVCMELLDILGLILDNFHISKTVLCHNDLFWGNLLFDAKKEKLWIIDWEYADWGDPFFDLASFCESQDLNNEERKSFLNYYLGRTTSINELEKLEVMSVIFLLKTVLWLDIQKQLLNNKEIESIVNQREVLAKFWRRFSALLERYPQIEYKSL